MLFGETFGVCLCGCIAFAWQGAQGRLQALYVGARLQVRPMRVACEEGAVRRVGLVQAHLGVAQLAFEFVACGWHLQR